ncbi:glycoside hydrolase family 127 protein [Fulvivirga maritima]|uniref:glycoside hydrolase family 127 protein n=1 Tax=Fulvivirga maritima TaxID=2904247 RepID=UPI001F1B618D|nr:glycoside hydrolase family 127 protein [Fulvivirga maritima]UII26181.1 glycoside hydrolase family 127 protein [Fulvivirga maritima]
MLVAISYSCSNTSDSFVVKQTGELKEAKKFDIEAVELLDGPFKHATELNIKTLLETFEPDRLLARFRIEAGLEPKAEPYGGWEAETIAGHTLGHYLKACALMYKTTGDERFADIVRHIVDELAECQAQDPDGYIGAFANGKKIFTEQIAKGEIRSQGFDLNGIWAPYYTQHKVLSGLIAAYELVGYEKGIEVAEKFSDWVYTVVNDLSHEEIQDMLHCEYGGISESFVELYGITNNEKYLELSKTFYDNVILDSLANEVDVLPGKHANTQIPKLIASARRYEITGDDKDKKMAKFFWDRVVHHHSYVTGGHCNHEYFGEPDHLTNRLSNETTETCNVYNMLKLSRHLFQWKPDAEIADFYERALFNHILASQHPQTGKVIYNLSLEMGGYKEYQDPYWFTCCVASALETHSKYGRNIYYHSEDELYIAQFIASTLNWEENGFKVTQNTSYPEEQSTKLTINTEKPQELAIKIRYPYWAKDGVVLTVNGKEQEVSQDAQSFVTLKKEWQDGDVIEVKFPFSLRLETMPDDSDRVAVMYGPLVLAGDLGEVKDSSAYDPLYVPVIMSTDRDPANWLRPVEGEPNTFETVEVGTPRQFVLKPFNKTFDRRYSVYFDMFSQEKWQAYQAEYQAKLEAKKAMEAKTVDFFQMGEMQPERDHSFTGDKVHVVEMRHRKARQAERGGSFEFTMKVKGDTPMTLVAEYWGGYTGSKTFDILVDGEKIATENITDKKPGEFLYVEYEIPTELTSGKDKVKVSFKPHEGHRAGPVFNVRTMKRESI